MNIRISFYLLILTMLASCNSPTNKHTAKPIDSIQSDDFPGRDKFITYKTFEQDFLDDVYGNMRLWTTPKGNFIKCTGINDSEFVYSCGREHKEVALYKINQNNPHPLPELVFDDYNIIILLEKSGSNSWQYDFICFSEDTIHRSQALYLDTANLRYIDLHYDSSDYHDVSFLVHYIRFNTIDTVKSNYGKYYAGFPDLHIGDVSLGRDKLFYSIYDTSNSVIRDTLSFFNPYD